MRRVSSSLVGLLAVLALVSCGGGGPGIPGGPGGGGKVDPNACGDASVKVRYFAHDLFVNVIKPAVFPGTYELIEKSRKLGLRQVVITGALVSDACDTILRSASQVTVQRGTRASPPADVVLAASRLRDGGVFVRMAGVSTEKAWRALRDHLSFLPPLIGDDLWSRKW